MLTKGALRTTVVVPSINGGAGWRPRCARSTRTNLFVRYRFGQTFPGDMSGKSAVNEPTLG